MLRYSEDHFAPNLLSTAGVDFKVRHLDINGKRVRCQLWDTAVAAALNVAVYTQLAHYYVIDATATVHTVHCCRTLAHTDTLLCTTLLLLLPLLLLLSAGQEKFHVITRAYYRGAHGIALIYDVTDADSFKNVNYWMANIQTHASAEPIHKVLLGNKVDLPSAREIPTDSGREVGEEFGVQFFEVSAKDGTGVNDAFHALVTEIVARLECEAAGAGEDSAANSGSGNAAGSSGKWLSRKA
eukprot:10834-Heterococcus_DN1.PRE.2